MPAADSAMVERLRAGRRDLHRQDQYAGIRPRLATPSIRSTASPATPMTSRAPRAAAAAAPRWRWRCACCRWPTARDYAGSLRNPAGWNNVFGFRTSFGRVPADGRDAFMPTMGVIGPMARNVPDLALLLSVQAGYDARVPLSIDGRRRSVPRPRWTRDFKGKRIAWAGDFEGYRALRARRARALQGGAEDIRDARLRRRGGAPDFSMEALWRAFLPLRAWQTGGPLARLTTTTPRTRALLKPEAIFEVESALKLSASTSPRHRRCAPNGTTRCAASSRRYDYFIVPTAQLFPFDADMHWPKEIAGATMETYHEWQKGVVPSRWRASGARGAGRLQRRGLADGDPDRRAQSRRLRVPATRPRL